MNVLLSRLARWAKGKQAPPTLVDLNPTDLCNLECKSCWQRNPDFENLDSSYQLKDDKFLQVVKQAIELGAKEFEITGGGEPLMRKELVLSAMRQIKKSNLMGNLTTNGTLFAKEDLKTVTELTWDQITVSVDGAQAETHDYLRGKKGTFKQIMRSLDQLNELKEQKSQLEPQIKFNCVLSNQNYDQVTDLIELAHRKGVQEVSFESLTVHSPQGKRLKMDEEEREEFASRAEEANKLARRYSIRTNLSSLKASMLEKANQMIELMDVRSSPSFTNLICYEPWYHLVVKVDGSANPCCLYDCQEANVKDKSLREIWYGSTFKGIRRGIRQGKPSKYCQICNAGQFERNKKIRKNLTTGLSEEAKA